MRQTPPHHHPPAGTSCVGQEWGRGRGSDLGLAGEGWQGSGFCTVLGVPGLG